MKKNLILFIILITSCSNNKTLNCNYIDYSSIYGTIKTTDKITIKKEKIEIFERNIEIIPNQNISNKNIYKKLKLEGKTFKKLVNGKYKINTNENNINIILKTKDTTNLQNIKINITENYDDIKVYYNDIGFTCE